MFKEPWWATSPIVVVPLGLFVLGLLFVPFAIWPAPNAAQFYGAFIAAIVAAGAALSGYFIQSELNVRRQRDEKKAAEDQDTLLVFGYIKFLQSRIEGIKASFLWLGYKQKDPLSPGPDDEALTNVKVIRHLNPEIELMQFERLMTLARAYPISISVALAKLNFDIALSKGNYQLVMLNDDVFPFRRVVDGTVKVLSLREQSLRNLLSDVEVYLKSRGLS